MTATEHTLQGGCGCGHVRYKLTAEPLVVHACHCHSCQRQSGSYHAVNALLETHHIVLLQGSVRQWQLATASGSGQTVARCAQCGVAVWSNYHRLTPGLEDAVRFIRVGTLDEPDQLPPDVHIYEEDKNRRVSVTDDAPRYPQFYELQDIWKPSSLRRFYALFEKQAAG